MGGEILKLVLLTLPTIAFENIRTQNVQYMYIKIRDPIHSRPVIPDYYYLVPPRIIKITPKVSL